MNKNAQKITPKETKIMFKKLTKIQTFCHSTVKCPPIFKNSFNITFSRKFANNVIIKYPTTLQTHRYTTLWNVNVSKLAHKWQSWYRYEAWYRVTEVMKANSSNSLTSSSFTRYNNYNNAAEFTVPISKLHSIHLQQLTLRSPPHSPK